MRKRPDVRELLHSTVPVGVAILLLATAPFWQPEVTEIGALTLVPLPLLIAIAALAGLYQPLGRRTLGLGLLVLPVVIWFYGVAWAGWVAVAAYALCELGRRFLFGLPLRKLTDIKVLPTLADAARVGVATVVAAAVWLFGTAAAITPVPARSWWLWGVAAAAAWVATLVLAHGPELWDLNPQRRRFPLEVARAAPLDVLGWGVGGLLLCVVLATGWLEALLIAAVIALLAAEVARNVFLRQRAVTRAAELWEVTRAGHRIIFHGPDLASMVEHVLAECRNILPFQWFQFELDSEDGSARSWFAGPAGELTEGLPQPADAPPALPGVHRRASWKIVQRQLKGDGEPIAMLRFWCDPRRLETASVELLDSLLPQIAAAVHRALLDRKAKQDPLTGLADRRVLEARLEEVFVQTYALGGSMAVVMCDLDRFKKINDTHGHDVGDRALKQVVEILEEHRRDTDLCSRYGGEEFALVLEKTDGETALRVAERLRTAVEKCLFVPAGRPIPLRLSAGVAAYPELQVKEGKDLLVLADEALIEAKKRGRNRSLLNLGRQRYKTARGRTLAEEEATSEPEAPTLFA